MRKVLLILTLLIIAPAFATDIKYFPAPSKERQNYIIGYGSLMESKSRQKTTPKADTVFPVQVCHFKRAWSFQLPGVWRKLYRLTFLAAAPTKKNSCFNAAFYPVSIDELAKTDARERSYKRVTVSNKQLKGLANNYLPRGDYWIYAIREGQGGQPSSEYPIVQSYVDVFLSGCLQIEDKFHLEGFATQCIETTHGWDTDSWVNDRIHPRRPFVHQPNAGKIDLLLINYFKDYPAIEISK